MAAELRAHCKSLGTDGKRCGMVQDAIEAGDLTVVDAILGAPAVLSRIPANMHANMQNMAKRKFGAAQEQAEACGKVSPRSRQATPG